MSETTLPWWRRWSTRAPLPVDAGLAALVTLLGLVSLGRTGSATATHEADLVGVVLVLLGGLPVAGRSRWPLLALAVTLPSSLAVFALGYPQINGGLGALLCLYSVAALREHRRSIPAGVGTGVVVGVVLLLAPAGGAGPADVAANLLAVALFWGAGSWARSRGAYVRGLEERNAALQQARDQDARIAMAEAREAVAREMQDLVGHHVMAMTVQAGAARRLVRRSPEAAEQAIGQVETLGRAAVEDVRRVLGVLTADGAPADTRPQPGLADLDDLVSSSRADGRRVELHRSGEDLPLGDGAALTVYRVVEEALDNVARHAGAADVTVRVHGGEGRVEVRVEDDGRGAPTWDGGAGVGLAAMRRRVESYGGLLRTGTLVGGGYGVTAVLPAGLPAGPPVRSQPATGPSSGGPSPAEVTA